MAIVSSGQITITDLSDGNDGVGIKTTAITYANSTSGTTAPSTGWTSSVPTLVKGQYLWTKTVWTYTDTSSKTAYSVSYNSKDGTNGTDGTSGIIVSSVAPDSPQNGQLWQDTSTTPQLIKKWTGSEWVIWELYVQNLKADTLSVLTPILGDVTAGTIKLMDANWVINGQPKMYGIYQSKFGLVSSGPTFSRSAIVSNSKMGVANLNRGELRFSVNDYTEDLKNVQEAGMSVQNNAFIKFNSYENGKDILLIGSSGDIVFSGDVEVTGNLTLPTKSWSGELGGGITLSLRKKGITVEYSIGGGISSNILTSSSLVKVSVPSEFCPKNRYSLVGHMAGNWNSFHIDITPSGVCQWYGPTTNTGTPRGTGTYPLD